jgi:hypothetical protein
MLLLIFCPPPPPQPAGTVATMAAADPVDYVEIAAEQNRCAERPRLLGGTSLKLGFCQIGAQHLDDDISIGGFRPIVPQKFRKDISAHFHNVAHHRRLTAHCIISSRFVWRGLSSDITTWTLECTPGLPAHPYHAAMFFSPSR